MSSHTFFKTQLSFILSYFIHIHISIRIILSKQPHSHFSHSNTLLFITNIILILSLLQSLHSIPILTTLQVSSLTHSSNLQFLYFIPTFTNLNPYITPNFKHNYIQFVPYLIIYFHLLYPTYYHCV